MKARSVAILGLTASLFALVAAGSSRPHHPIGTYVRNGELIVVATTEVSPAEMTFVVKEVLKGTISRGERITVPLTRMWASAIDFPKSGVRVTVLLEARWRSDAHPILEIYKTVRELAAVRALVTVYAQRDERARLVMLRDLALKDLATDKESLLATQLYADFIEMRNPANFGLILDTFDRVDAAGQRSIITVLERIGDQRGVPALIRALASQDRWVALGAAAALANHFPGAPGVEQTFRRVRPTGDLATVAKSYLARYDRSIRSELDANRTDFQRVSQFLERGEKEKARSLFLRMLRDREQAKAMISFLPDWFEDSVATHPHNAGEILKGVLPVATELARSDSYLDNRSAARALRSLRDPAAVEPLLILMNDRAQPPLDFIHEPAFRMAAFALIDRGGAAREAALAKLRARQNWPALRAVIEHADDRSALIDMLRRLNGESRHESSATANWVIYRLGDLREKRAVPELVNALTKSSWDSATIVEALIRIGGRETEDAVSALLQAGKRELRVAAMDVLFRLQGERFLPALRRMLASPHFGDKPAALTYLAHIGEPRDLEILVPMSDFWRGDRQNHFHLMSAIAEIRRRHGYDVNGKIVE